MLLTDVGSVLACGNNEHNKLGLNQRQGFLMAMKNIFNKVEEEKECIQLHIQQNIQQWYNTEMINKQCNAGDPQCGPPSTIMLIQYKICARETVNRVQCSIILMSSCHSSRKSVRSVLPVDFRT